MELKNKRVHEQAKKIEVIHENELTNLQNSIHDSLFFMRTSYFLLAALLEGAEVKNNVEYNDVTQLLLIRGMKTFLSIISSLSSGCDQDAIAMSRSLDETVATLQFITQGEVSKRAVSFREYEHANRLNSVDSHSKAGSQHVVQPGLVNLALKKVSVLRALFGKKLKGHWSGTSGISGIYKAIGRQDDYAHLFTTASLLTHPTYLSRHQYMLGNPGRLSWFPSSKHAVPISTFCTDMLLDLVNTYRLFHGMNSDQEIVTEIVYNREARCKLHGFNSSDPNFAKIEPAVPGVWIALT